MSRGGGAERKEAYGDRMRGARVRRKGGVRVQERRVRGERLMVSQGSVGEVSVFIRDHCFIQDGCLIYVRRLLRGSLFFFRGWMFHQRWPFFPESPFAVYHHFTISLRFNEGMFYQG